MKEVSQVSAAYRSIRGEPSKRAVTRARWAVWLHPFGWRTRAMATATRTIAAIPEKRRPGRDRGIRRPYARAETTAAQGYYSRVPDDATDNGFPSEDDVDVEALFVALREEIRRSGGDPAAPGEPDDRLAARAEAERLWPVSADRSLRLRPGVRGGIGTPAKAVLKKMMRWYVEPLAYDQRSFNAAALRLIDDLEQRVASLEAELARLRAADPR